METKQKETKPKAFQARKLQQEEIRAQSITLPQAHQTVLNSETYQTAPDSKTQTRQKQPESDALAESNESSSERAQNLPETQDRSIIESVYSLIEAGDFKKALLVLEKLLEISPNDKQALLLKVQLLLYFRKLRDADKTANKIIELYPKDHHIYLAKAMSTFLYTNNIREAVSYLNKGLELKLDCFELVIAKAQMLYWLGDAAYNAWIQQASQIDSLRTDEFLKKYWIKKLETPPSHIGAQYIGLIQSMMFLASQQSFGGWK